MYFEGHEKNTEELHHLPQNLEEPNILVKYAPNIPYEETTTFKKSFGFVSGVFIYFLGTPFFKKKKFKSRFREILAFRPKTKYERLLCLTCAFRKKQ